jgi:hypothetical protein
MLDCKAPEEVIQGHAVWSVGRVRDLLYAIGRSSQPISSEHLAHKLNSIAIACSAKPFDDAVNLDKVSLSGRIARMQDAAWWRRNLRKQLLRENEAVEHAAGAIHRDRQCYVSDHAVKAKAARRKANAATLAALEVVNEDGEVFNLGDVAAGTVSNPAVRRGELMLRCRGFGEVADHWGHVARFLTITCPSRFHKFTGPIHDQKPNPKWDGSTPKDGQSYLSKVWARIRAAWKRKGYAPYGFRVAEPHHEGCPHWHILLWMPPEDAGFFNAVRVLQGRRDYGAGVVGIAGWHAMRDSTSEISYRNRGARFTVEVVDPARGNAAGYIAKYISKNIDGLQADGRDIGEDLEAQAPVAQAANRVRDWAGVHGIRQFQQIGGPSVTVWRELRRMRDESAGPVQMAFDFETPRTAADNGDWASFWRAQGGPMAERSQYLKPFTMETDSGRYGDTVKRVMGVESPTGILFRTRVHEWTVQRAGAADCDTADHEQRVWLEVVKINHELERKYGLPLSEGVRFPLWPGFGAQRPRTCVNNCTPTGEELRPEPAESLGGGGSPPIFEGENPCFQ